MSPKPSVTTERHATTDRPTPTVPLPAGDRRLRRALAVAVAVTSLWLVALLLLAVRTANPVTLNRGQLLASDAVIVARPDLATVRDDTVEIAVTSRRAGRDVPSSLRLGNASIKQFRAGVSYLIPLKAEGRGYEVAPVPTLRLRPSPQGPVLQPVVDPENRTAVFYPASDDVLRTAERILATRTARPYP